MAKRKPYKNITIHPAQGGALIGSASDDVPITQESNYLSSSANYTEKINFRRETDGELRREGWEVFNPSNSDLAKWGNIFSSVDGVEKVIRAIDSEYPIRAIHQFPGTDGTPVLIVIAGGTVWRLFSESDVYAKNYQDESEIFATENGGSAGTEYWINAGENFYWRRIYTFPRHMDQTLNGELLSPFDGGAYRWEIIDVQNHVIINNGVDLPIIYKSEYDLAEPIYSLRENGVLSVGTIGSFQDRLFCADLTVIVDGYDDWFTDNSTDHDPYGYLYESPLYGQVKAQRFQYRMVYSAEGVPGLFNSGTVLNGAVVMESGGLPVTVTVTTSGEYQVDSNYNFKLGTPLSTYKFLSNGINGGEEAYAVHFIDQQLTTIKTVNEDGGLIVSGVFLTAGTGSQDSEYATGSSPSSKYAIDYGDDEIYGTGDDGTQDYFESSGELKFVDNAGNNIVFNDPVNSGNLVTGTYQAVLRPYIERVSAPAQFREFAQDGSRILKMKELADKLVVYRDSGFFFMSKTNSAEVPFAIEPRYRGGRVADFRHTVIDVDGKQHIFMGNSGIYAINRSSTEPQPISLFEIGPPFWQLVPPDLAEFVYAVDNPITREVFINCPLGLLQNGKGDYIDEAGKVIYDDTQYDYAVGVGIYGDDLDTPGDQEYWVKEVLEDPQPKIAWGVIAYDYVNKTLSTIDASFTSAAYIRRPKHNRVGPEEAWFVMGIHQVDDPYTDRIYPGTQYREDYEYGGVLVRYGYGPPKVGEREPYRLYSRLGFGYTSKIKSGLIDFGDSFSDKEVRTYVLELSSKYGTTPVRVRISTTTSPQGTEQVETMQTIDGQEIDYVELNNLVDENMIPMYIKAPYVRDELTVLPEYNYQGGVLAESGYVEQQLEFFDTETPTIKSNPIKLVGRTFEVSGVDTRSATQAYNQG
jgi:hypothetical protein